MPFTTNPERQIRIERLAKALRELPIRSVASYDDLSAQLGEDVRAERLALMRARELVEKETGMRFATVRGEGIKKLDAAAIPGIGEEARASIARRARRKHHQLTGLKYNDIDPALQTQIDAERSLLGAIAATAKAKATKLAEHTATGPIIATRVFELVGSKN